MILDCSYHHAGQADGEKECLLPAPAHSAVHCRCCQVDEPKDADELESARRLNPGSDRGEQEDNGNQDKDGVSATDIEGPASHLQTCGCAK